MFCSDENWDWDWDCVEEKFMYGVNDDEGMFW